MNPDKGTLYSPEKSYWSIMHDDNIKKQNHEDSLSAVGFYTPDQLI